MSFILTTQDLSKIIRNARKEQGLTQEDLAGLACTGRRFIVDIEDGKETAQIGKILKVLNALGVSLNSSYTWSDRHENTI